MEKIVKQGLLYDFYGALLNDHQRSIYESVVYDNMSLSEIASEHGISRQGVHDLIKRCDKSLEEYENKLHLVERFMAIKDEVETIEIKAESAEIKAIAAKILEQL
ncbi:MAG: DNA-binding protein [Lachnospiraceae bacterium]|nr:DNA-binding protein [Lachnospiraceae bacterium]